MRYVKRIAGAEARRSGVQLSYGRADTPIASETSKLSSKVQNYLVYTLEDQPQQVVIWDIVEITVGRMTDQDIQILDEEISRKHAIFRKEGDRFSVEDLNTSLGTQVNGEEIRGRREIAPGDWIQIGPLQLQFGATEQQIPRGSNVRFGSELKGFRLPVEAEEDGRTVLGLAPEDVLVETRPTLRELGPAAPVALSASGDLEVSEVQDLDGLFDEDEPDGFEIGEPTVDLVSAAQPAADELSDQTPPSPARQGNARVRVALDIEGPADRVRAILAALIGQEIQVPPLKLRVHPPDGS